VVNVAEKKVEYDLDGYDVITNGLLELLDQFPGMPDGEQMGFSALGEERGKAIFPTEGPVIEQEKTSVTGIVTQYCSYPFHVIYRESGLSESRKIKVKEWLDTLGRWLEKQVVKVNGQEEQLTEYPPLTGTRQFTTIRRMSGGYLDSTNENKSENWAIYINARYTNIFKR
jgi:hypothetical protein